MLKFKKDQIFLAYLRQYYMFFRNIWIILLMIIPILTKICVNSGFFEKYDNGVHNKCNIFKSSYHLPNWELYNNW